MEQRHGAGIGVGLEHDDGALIAQRLDRIQQSSDLTGMVRIVVVNVGSVILALEFKASSRSRKTGKAVFDGGGLYAEAYAGRSRRKSVFEVMLAGDMDADGFEELTLIHDVKFCERAETYNVFGIDVGLI